MRKFLILLIILAFLPSAACAAEITAPEVPSSAEKYMPEETESFSEGLWYILKEAFSRIQPELTEAAGICAQLIAVALLVSLVTNLGSDHWIAELVGVLTVGALLIKPANSLISLGLETVTELTEYGKLLLPVMTTALAAEGAVTSSAAMYAGTTLFSAILSTTVRILLVPLIYMYMALCIADSAFAGSMLKEIKKLVKWLITWVLKITLYVYTGYISITGVISGTADASAIKAAKLAISGVVPVVGSIISDASETILVSMGFMKHAAGIYGLLAILAACIGPFLKISVQYLLLKATAAVCGVFGSKKTVDLIGDFSGTMGFILAMTGTACLLLLIGTVCFMKGIG